MSDAIIEAAARALVARMEEITEHPSFKSVWMINQLHNGVYTGPTWVAELDALKATLAGKDTVAPLIRAAALEEAAKVAELVDIEYASIIAAHIRALKEQP
jgi:hypothetical protein